MREALEQGLDCDGLNVGRDVDAGGVNTEAMTLGAWGSPAHCKGAALYDPQG